MQKTRAILRIVGSLWFAAVLLVLLMVTMGSATVFETAHGTERALATFYHALWFKLLLALIAMNLLAALLSRIPFTRRQTGFVLAHAGILLTFAGALVTDRIGVDGQVAVAEGQSTGHFRISRDSLKVMNNLNNSMAAIDLDPSVFGGFSAVEHPEADDLSLEVVRKIEVKRYLPDMVWQEIVLNDSPTPSPAVEVSLSANGRENPAWIFPGQSVVLGTTRATFRQIPDPEELDRLISGSLSDSPGSVGKVRAEVAGVSFEVPVEDCTQDAVPLKDSGYTIRVLRYLPHAVVGQNGEITSATEQPVNPAVDIEISGPGGSENRLAFANFPDFKSMHGAVRNEELKLTFISSAPPLPTEPIEVLCAPDGGLYARFHWAGTKIVSTRIDLGKPVETPWPGKRFAVLRRFDSARKDRIPVQPDPLRKNREPALLLEISGPEETIETWLHKYRPQTQRIGESTFELRYGDKILPLGFDISLNRFRIGYYPGGERPRSFESHITLSDPATGGNQDRIISMNNPTGYGGYTFYQSSYRQEGDRLVSFLSVSRDPGQPIAFAGYVATAAGMLLVLVTRMRDQRRKKRLASVESISRNG